MKKRYIFLIVAFFMIIIDQKTQAEEPLNRGQAIALVRDTFSVQVALSEQPRTIEEIFSLLNPYVTPEFRQSFLEANLVYVDGKYQTFGSDFAPSYIPFFTFAENTKFTLVNDKAYVYEEFTANPDGPVRYQEGFRGVELKLTKDGWKVHKVLSPDEMKPIIEKVSPKSEKIANWNLESLDLYLSTHTLPVIPSIYFVPLYF